MTIEPKFGPLGALSDDMQHIRHAVSNMSTVIDRLETGSAATFQELSGMRQAISRLYGLVAIGVTLGAVALALNILEKITG